MRGRLAVLAVLLAILPAPAMAQDGEWPTRAVRLIVPSGPGGNPDVMARILADRFTSKFGKPFVVENMPGAGRRRCGQPGRQGASRGPYVLFR